MRFPLSLSFYLGEGMTADNNYFHRTRVKRYGDGSSKIQLGNWKSTSVGLTASR